MLSSLMNQGCVKLTGNANQEGVTSPQVSQLEGHCVSFHRMEEPKLKCFFLLLLSIHFRGAIFLHQIVSSCFDCCLIYDHF